MTFLKNSELILNICLVQIKSIDDTVDISSLETIYGTPSKIRCTGSNSNSNAGVVAKKRLSLSYPGIAQDDFEKFNDLARGEYQVYVKETNGKIWEVASDYFPMQCSTTFNIEQGHVLLFTSNSPIPIKYRDTQLGEGIAIDGFNYDFDFYLN